MEGKGALSAAFSTSTCIKDGASVNGRPCVRAFCLVLSQKSKTVFYVYMVASISRL